MCAVLIRAHKFRQHIHQLCKVRKHQMSLPLQQELELIPENNRYCLDQELVDNGHLTTIANSIIDWPIVAGHIPGVTNADVEGIRHNDPFSLQLQRYLRTYVCIWKFPTLLYFITPHILLGIVGARDHTDYRSP